MEEREHEREREREKVDGRIKVGAVKQLTRTAERIIATSAPPLQSHHCALLELEGSDDNGGGGY